LLYPKFKWVTTSDVFAARGAKFMQFKLSWPDVAIADETDQGRMMLVCSMMPCMMIKLSQTTWNRTGWLPFTITKQPTYDKVPVNIRLFSLFTNNIIILYLLYYIISIILYYIYYINYINYIILYYIILYYIILYINRAGQTVYSV